MGKKKQKEEVEVKVVESNAPISCVMVNQEKADFHLVIGEIKVGKKMFPNEAILKPRARHDFEFSKEQLEDVKKQIKSRNIAIKVKE